MSSRFEAFYRGLLAVLAVGLFWVVWGSARGAETGGTNAPAASTNAAPTSGGGTTNLAAAPTNAAPFRLIEREHLTLGLDRVTFLRENRMFGIPYWQYLASFVYLFLAFYVSKFLDYVARIWLRTWAERTASRADDLLLELANGPIKVVSFVVLLHVGLSIFDWPPLVERWLSVGLKIIVAISITYAILKVVDLGVGAWGRRGIRDEDRTFDQQLGPILRKAFKALVVIVATVVTLDNVGVNITGLVASLSIGGLALGLAAQDTVANLFGAVAVLVDRPFKVGDRVRFEGVDGVVETIGLRSTRVRHLDGHLITVPNKTMGNATITNMTLRPSIRTVLNFGLTYDTTADRVERAVTMLREIFEAHPKTTEVVIGFKEFGDFSLNIEVVHVWGGTDPQAYVAAIQALNLEIMRRFAAEKIEFAFPTQTLLVRTA